MARQNKDVFGFDELEKSFKRFEKNYPDKADALLMAQGQAVNRKTKSLTPVKTKKLRNSWRLKKVKLQGWNSSSCANTIRSTTCTFS